MVGHERNASASEPNLGAQLVHNHLQMGTSDVNDSTQSGSKYVKAGGYEQGRMIKIRSRGSLCSLPCGPGSSLQRCGWYECFQEKDGGDS
jgi:hypothetical protein